MRELTEKLEDEAWRKYYERRKATAEELGISEEEVTGIAPPIRTGLPCPFTGAFRDADGVLSQSAISLLTPAIKAVHHCITEVDGLDVHGQGYPWSLPRIEGQGDEPAQSVAERLWVMRNDGTIGVPGRFAGAPPTDVAAPACRRPR